MFRLSVKKLDFLDYCTGNSTSMLTQTPWSISMMYLIYIWSMQALCGTLSCRKIQLLEKVQKYAANVCTKQWNWSYEELQLFIYSSSNCCILYNYIPTLQVRCKIMKLILLYKYNNMVYFSEQPLPQHQPCYLTCASHRCHLQYLNGHIANIFLHFSPFSMHVEWTTCFPSLL